MTGSETTKIAFISPSQPAAIAVRRSAATLLVLGPVGRELEAPVPEQTGAAGDKRSGPPTVAMVPALQFEYWQWLNLQLATPVVFWASCRFTVLPGRTRNRLASE